MEAEREHLFLLGLGRLHEVRYRACDTITPRLQRVLDVFTDTPAIVRTATWDVIAWNRAAAAVFTDYGQLAPTERNVLRLMFCDPRMRGTRGIGNPWPGWSWPRFVTTRPEPARTPR